MKKMKMVMVSKMKTILRVQAEPKRTVRVIREYQIRKIGNSSLPLAMIRLKCQIIKIMDMELVLGAHEM
ncbi:hypothetical protein FGO68_gene10333 [Halteria grandinella]|uniref:Uncharacterized protein n=1 Tax=Halteria grandinella TaxID=5974 RepID=A0A8J8TA70_HALGN|nr:hypothetical protein FGO68_gene10333 [Halteria grandinella]